MLYRSLHNRQEVTVKAHFSAVEGQTDCQIKAQLGQTAREMTSRGLRLEVILWTMKMLIRIYHPPATLEQ